MTGEESRSIIQKMPIYLFFFFKKEVTMLLFFFFRNKRERDHQISPKIYFEKLY